MSAMTLERAGSLWLIGNARKITAEDQVDRADSFGDWEIEKSNPMLMWIAGNFVEADKPNSNKQFWHKDELALSEYTIKYAPLNMVHKTKQPVGFYLATKTVDLTTGDESSAWEMPTDDEVAEAKQTDWGKTPSGANAPYKIVKKGEKFAVVNNAGDTKASFDTRAQALAYQRALYANVKGAGKRADKVTWTGKSKDRVAKASEDDDEAGTMKIQTLAGMWSHVFPFEAQLVEQADEANSLYFSMECRGTHLHCAGPDGCDGVFDYMAAEDHCDHIKERSSIRHIVNPTFRGGALILPPVRPGWSGANASVYQDAVLQEAAFMAEQHEKQYELAKDDNPEMTPAVWERLMAGIVALAGPLSS